jgi:hypothetical protein
MIIKYSNGDELHFPNIQEATNIESAPVEEPQWIRDAKGNWVRES